LWGAVGHEVTVLAFLLVRKRPENVAIGEYLIRFRRSTGDPLIHATPV
jgi:hypothetical protein